MSLGLAFGFAGVSNSLYESSSSTGGGGFVGGDDEENLLKVKE